MSRNDRIEVACNSGLTTVVSQMRSPLGRKCRTGVQNTVHDARQKRSCHTLSWHCHGTNSLRWEGQAECIGHVSCRHAAAALDAGDPSVTLHSAMAKRFATDTCFGVANDALQLLGGYGCHPRSSESLAKSWSTLTRRDQAQRHGQHESMGVTMQ